MRPESERIRERARRKRQRDMCLAALHAVHFFALSILSFGSFSVIFLLKMVLPDNYLLQVCVSVARVSGKDKIHSFQRNDLDFG